MCRLSNFYLINYFIQNIQGVFVSKMIDYIIKVTYNYQ